MSAATNPLSIATKVSASHRDRVAYLYVRQSTLRQVLNNTESAERQYALRERAVALGWPAERIVVIDQDQAHSGASAADREGFQRLVAEVGMGRAGIVLGLEVSRLARNSADWHRLLEICAMSDTLICDEDGLYDPSDFNDRLLLGLKGQMSEAELHFIRARLRGGQLSKARRGELRVELPVGLIYDPAGNVVLDPDSGVQHAVGHLLATFQRTGSARAVVQTFNQDGLLFPVRVRTGPHRGELAWMPLYHWRVLGVLHNPRYAGAFVYGRRRARKTPDGKIRYQALPREQWTSLILDAHPGYVSFEQYEHNLKTLAHNAQARGHERAAGPAREGPALLQGLVICAHCGERMTVRYRQRRDALAPTYQCNNEAVQAAGRRCLSIPGRGVDHAISQLLLDTVTPLAMEVALTVQGELETRANDADQLRKSHVQRAQQRAELARRRYLQVDPENRLVADTLEADWNDALRAHHAAHDEYERATTAANAQLTDEHKQRVRQLAADFPALWSDPTTPQRERKRIARLLIEDVTLNKTDQIHLHVRFRGGQTTSIAIPRPPRGFKARQTSPDALAMLNQLLDDHTDAQTAELLNHAGHRSRTGQLFTTKIVIGLRDEHNLPSHGQRLRARGLLTRAELAEQLGVHTVTIRNWERAGLLTYHTINDRDNRLYDPPTPDDPRLVKHQGRRRRAPQPIPTTAGGAV
jgi:DNA invertase Pin-like site-specific DNA recombinase